MTSAAQEQAIRDQHNAEITKLATILHSSPAPVTGHDSAVYHHTRAMDRLMAKYEHRVLSTLPNGIQHIGVYDRGVLVNKYHGKL